MASDDKEARRAAALRENLRKRKERARAERAAPVPAPGGEKPPR